MAFQTPFLFREYKTWLDIFWNSSSSLSKINTSRPFKFSKNNCGHAIWLMAHFLKNVDLWLIYDSNVCNMHILWIRILWRFFSNANFRNPPTQNFKYWFSLKCVGVIFFRPHIRIQKNKILHQMICVDIGLPEIRLRKCSLIETHSSTPTPSTRVCWRGLKMTRQYSEGSKTIITKWRLKRQLSLGS